MAVQRFLILARTSPYGSQQARAAIDVALTAAAFEQKVTVVFLDAGVLQLQPDQDTRANGLKNVGNMLPALKLYDVEAVYAHTPSVREYGMNIQALQPDVGPIDDDSLQDLLAAANQVMVF